MKTGTGALGFFLGLAAVVLSTANAGAEDSPKLRRMRKAEISPAMLEVAARVVRQNYAKPVGTQVELEVDGKHVYARIERHYHPEGGPVKPWGCHPGVSLFCER